MVENWERYAKAIFSSEVDRENTPGINRDNNGEDDDDSGDNAGSSSILKIKILRDEDQMPIFPISDMDEIPTLPVRKTVIRDYLKALYRQFPIYDLSLLFIIFQSMKLDI